MHELLMLVEAGAEAHAEPALFGVMTATVWVSVSMLILIAIVLWRGVPASIAKSLDKRIGEIKAELDEARDLRTEAEKLRAEYESKLAAAATEAEEMRHRAELESASILEQAQQDATDLVERRKKLAEDKIGAAERAALAEIRSKVATAATGAAVKLVAENHGAEQDKALVEKTIAGLGKALN